jgi:predicted Zn finger-like uncharacterized protein
MMHETVFRQLSGVPMIIECPACQSRYRIREEKLPQEGGGIKCPNCAHVFFVAQPGSASPAAPPAPALPANAGPGVDELTQALASAAAAVGVAPPSTTGPTSAVTDRPATLTGRKAVDGPKWKARNAGLTLDFADIESLKRWLAGRESFDGIEVSQDGAAWSSLLEAAEFADVRPSGRKTMLGVSAIPRPAGGGEAAPPTVDALKAEAEKRLMKAREDRGVSPDAPVTPPGAAAKRDAKAEAAKEDKKKFQRLVPPEVQKSRQELLSRILGYVALIVLPFFLVIGLHVSGTVDLSGVVPFLSKSRESGAKLVNESGRELPAETVQYGPGNAAPTVTEAPPPPPKPGPTGTEAAAQATQGNTDTGAVGSVMLYQARTSLTNGDAAGAKRALEQAATMAPNNREVICLLAGVYGALNDPRAESTAVTCRSAGGSPASVTLPAPPAEPAPAAAAAQPTEPAPAAGSGEAAPADEPPQTIIRRRVQP